MPVVRAIGCVHVILSRAFAAEKPHIVFIFADDKYVRTEPATLELGIV